MNSGCVVCLAMRLVIILHFLDDPSKREDREDGDRAKRSLHRRKDGNGNEINEQGAPTVLAFCESIHLMFSKETGLLARRGEGGTNDGSSGRKGFFFSPRNRESGEEQAFEYHIMYSCLRNEELTRARRAHDSSIRPPFAIIS